MAAIPVEPGTIAFYSDIGCPWASLAVHRLRTRRSELGLDAAVLLDHRCFPLELINGRVTPKPLLDSETAVVGSHEPELHWRPWRRRDREYPSTTLLVLEAVQAAKAEEVGGLSASEELDAALRHAWYSDSRSIHLYDELLDVAAGCEALDQDALAAALQRGAGRSAVFAQWRQATEFGVQGSPHLYLADGFDLHNPGITVGWGPGAFKGMPRIERDEPGVYDEILHRAAA